MEVTADSSSPSSKPFESAHVTGNTTSDEKIQAQRKQKKLKAAALPSTDKSVDTQVQHTNDDSIVSKRSAGRHGYIADDYLRYFVGKLSRRSPLINRGYYLRIFAMTELVTRTLRNVFLPLLSAGDNAPRHVQVISLGAGYDTLAARLYQIPGFESVHYYEVDFPEVIRNKTGLMDKAPLTQFPFLNAHVLPGHAGIMAHRYASIGLDLRQASHSLIPLLKERSIGQLTGFDATAPTILYSECVTQYMTPECSTDLVTWIAATFPQAVYFSYDQIHPGDGFGQTMLRSLRSKCSPLLGVDQFPDGTHLSRRATASGMKHVRFADFYDISRYLIHTDELQRVDNLEAFDEFEEWAEMCEHYGILSGCTDASLGERIVRLFTHSIEPSDGSKRSAEADAPAGHDSKLLVFRDLVSDGAGRVEPSVEATDVLVAEEWPTGRCAIEGWGFGGIVAEAGSPASDASSSYFVAFGGLLSAKGQSRSNAVLLHSLSLGDVPVTVEGSEYAPPGLVFHSFSRLAKWTYLVHGGRTNPTDVSARSYVLTVDPRELPDRATATWHKVVEVGAVPMEGRYRHAACTLRELQSDDFANDFANVVVFGGRAGDGRVLDDWLGCTLRRTTDDATGKAMFSIAWAPMVCATQPPALFSASLAAISKTTAVLSGGARWLGGSSRDVYVVTFRTEDENGGGLLSMVRAVRSAVRLPHSAFSHTSFTMEMAIPDGTATSSKCLVVQGGSTLDPKPSDDLRSFYAIPLTKLLEEVPAESEGSRASASQHPLASFDWIRWAMPKGCTADTTWTRHAAVPLIQHNNGSSGVQRVALIGGGFTAFSFGTYTLKPCLVKFPMTAATLQLSSSQTTEVVATPSALPRPNVLTLAAQVPVIRYDSDRFLRTIMQTIPEGPVCFTSVPLGRCLTAWQEHDALLSSADAAKVISIHVGKGTLPYFDFVRKNFVFRHVPLRDMLAHCFAADAPNANVDEFWYFRSVGHNMKTDRSDFWKEFPELGADVTLPDDAPWRAVRSHLHQSCFRVNQKGMQLWTHYDTSDNVLLQLVGSKRVVLFPPSQFGNLYMKGSSSRVTSDITLPPDTNRFPRFAEAMRHATVVTLTPGDMLFIPANWFHHITALTTCVGLNLFYLRPTMAPSLFDEKDLYGNKDLPCCTAFRSQTVQDVVQRLTQDLTKRHGVPRDYAAFTLRQLIVDLEEAADAFESDTKQH